MSEDRYDVRFTARAGRDLDRLPEKIAVACVEFIYGPLRADPYRLGKPFVGEFKGHHSARRGAYRVIYRIDDARILIDIVHIDHRAQAYRR